MGGEYAIGYPGARRLLNFRDNLSLLYILQLTSLVWRKCHKLPDHSCMWDAQAMSSGGKLYIGGGTTDADVSAGQARLYVYTAEEDSWDVIDTPVYWFALTTYHSQLVLVGGVVYSDDSFSNRLWILDTNKYEQWQETLPPMFSKRFNSSAVSHVDYLVVAGGEDMDGYLDTVEVYDGQQWTEIQPLPYPSANMKSAVFKGHWYLMGGYGQGEEVYFASLDTIVDSCDLGDRSVSLWERLADVPFLQNSSPAVLGKRLIAVGGRSGRQNYSRAIHAYSHNTQSWVVVGVIPVEISNTCTSVLPTGELLVVGGQPAKDSNMVFKVAIEGEFQSSLGPWRNLMLQVYI